MPYKIEGFASTPGRLLLVEESDWSVVGDINVDGDYTIDELDNNNDKLVICKETDGRILCYGAVTPVSYPWPMATTFGLQIKANEHLNAGYTLNTAWETDLGGSLHLDISYMGFAGVFFSMAKTDLQGKKIKLIWSKTSGHSSDDNYFQIIDGKYDRTSSTDFPDTNHSDYVYYAAKGGGTLWNHSTEGAFETQTTVTTPVLSLGGSLDDVTCIIWHHDGSSANNPHFYIYDIQILDGTTNEVISSMSRGLTPVMENTAGVADWGYYGDWDAFYE